MRKYTLEQYQKMADKFNDMSFRDKIKTIMDNKDILAIGSDNNWYVVRVKDKEIEDELHDTDTGFSIENEWSDREMCDLIDLLNIDNLGC
jgi:hypothetical protein